MNRLAAAWHRAGVRNFALNVAGNVVPMVVALASFPILSRLAGIERLGVLGLTWALIGYLSLLDLGLTRVVVRRVAQTGSDRELASESAFARRIAWLLAAFTAAVAIILALLAPIDWLLGNSETSALRAESALALWIVLLTVPLVVATAILRGVLEGRQRFGYSNAFRMVFGSWSFAAPALVALWHPTLPALVASIAVGRVLGLVAHVMALNAIAPRVEHQLPELKLRQLIAEGGWLTVTNVVGPLMVTFDRFVVAGLVSVAAAAYYTVPQEVVLRLLLIPAALAGTVFPLLAQTQGAGDRAAARAIGDRSTQAALALALPLCLGLAAFAEPALYAWMGPDFARVSAPVAAILAGGLLVNCVAQIPFAWLQAAGRADVTGRLHLAELPVYLLLLIALTHAWGIVGTAVAWSLRTAADCLLLYVLAERTGLAASVQSQLGRIAAGLGCVLAVAISTIALDGTMRYLVSAAPIAVGLTLAWRCSVAAHRRAIA